jgi:hypothetical protein
MKKRLAIAAVVAASAIIVLVMLMWNRSGTGDPSRSGLHGLKRRTPSGPWQALAKQSGESHFEAAPVFVKFDGKPLPEVLDELVKLTGISVTADLDENQEKTLVTMQANIPPLETLMNVAEEYGLELVETNAGWWLRPESPAVHRIYQPSLLSMDEGRTQRLIQTLREIINSGDPAKAAASVSIDSGGIHITASKEKQNFVSSYLNVLFNETVASKNGDAPVSAIPPLPQ